MSRIEGHADLRGYFRERLMAALSRRGVRPAETTEFYLVNLLARYAMASHARGLERPLVEWFRDALEAPDVNTRFRRFREMGDVALCVAGFFFDHLRRRGISHGYVVTMGERAYARASHLAPWAAAGAEAAFGETYDELADGFGDFAQVLDDVREETALRTPQDIVRLYDRWRHTGSPLLAERLKALGVYPHRGDSSEGAPTLH